MSEASLPFPRPEAPQALWRLRTDEQLSRRAAEGDERAFAEIFRRYSDDLYRFCLAMTGSSHDAQEALQNAMVKALRALPGEQRQIRLKPWIYRVARNEAIEIVRRRREGQELDSEQLSAEATADTAELRERLRRLLADLELLPERQRSVLLMRELAGLEFADIGAAYGTSAAAARQALYEARLGLRALEEGRERRCADVRKELSDADGRAIRRLRTRSHLRECPECRAFGDAIVERRRDLAALAPLPAGAAAGLLHGLLGGHGGGGAGGGLAGTVAPAAQAVAVPAAVKSAAAVAIAAVAVGTAGRSGLIELPGPIGGAAQSRGGAAPSLDAPPAGPAGTPGGSAARWRAADAGPAAAPIRASGGPGSGRAAEGAATNVPPADSRSPAEAPAPSGAGQSGAGRDRGDLPSGRRGRPEQPAAGHGAQLAGEKRTGHAPAATGPPASAGEQGPGAAQPDVPPPEAPPPSPPPDPTPPAGKPAPPSSATPPTYRADSRGPGQLPQGAPGE